MTSVAWHLLLANHVIGTTCPILSVPAIVAVDFFVLVDAGNEERAIKSTRIISEFRDTYWMYTLIVENFPFDLPGCGAEPLIL